MKHFKVIETKKYYPKHEVGFRTDGEDGDPNAERTNRPLVEDAAAKNGFGIVGVRRERDKATHIEYCIFSLEARQPVKSHEAWWKRINSLMDALPRCRQSYTFSPWDHEDLEPYFKACRLQERMRELDESSFLYGASDSVLRTMHSVYDHISREVPAEQRRLVRSRQFLYLSELFEYYLEWMNENIEHMAR